MKKNKKMITTKKNIKWKIIDVIFYIIIFVFNLKILIVNSDEVANVYKNSNDLLVCVIWTLLLVLVIFVNNIPYIAVYNGFRYAIKKFNKEKVTFDVENDLEYYRDIFNNISPATMSLLMDLELEFTKDLGAMKLYYELNNIYFYIDDGKICLNNPKGIKLNNSDNILLKYFFEAKNKNYVLNEWKENVICEAINNNLIKRKTYDDKKNKNGCGVIFLANFLSFIFIMYTALNLNKLDAFYLALENISEDNLSILQLVASNPDYIISSAILFLTIVAVFIWIWSFISGIIHIFTSSYIRVKDKIKRTKDGNILTEKLYGMKNFIHDFSNLDEVTKKQLILWEEFLIYAVVLEENDIILKEISDMYQADLLKYKHYNN